MSDAERARAAGVKLAGARGRRLSGADAALLPEPAFRILLETLEQMARGNVVAVTPLEALLTTQQAAELLGVSRPHLVKLLESGAIPFSMTGTHRRVRLGDLDAYRAGARKGNVMALDSIEDAIAAIARGELVVVVDDDDRENEGDLVAAASRITPQQIAFMVRLTSGILCAPLTRARAEALQLDPMVKHNNAPLGTAFTISVDYREGLTTGIAAEERANTVRALANGNVGAADFVRPGHVFPLIAEEGGVLMRSGHTEATVDLARLGGLPEAGVLGELVNDDGTVKRLPALVAFAREHHLKIVSIADLIAWRRRREKLIDRVSETAVETEIGPARAVSYATRFDNVQHLALVYGDVAAAKTVPVRIHRQEVLADVFGRAGPNLISESLAVMKRDGAGVLVYLREGASGVAPAAGKSEARRERLWREVGIGAQILKDLGLSRIKLLTTHKLDYIGLAGYDIALVESAIIGAQSSA